MGAHLRDAEWEAQVMRDEQAEPDPGDPGPHGDPAVSRVTYALRDLRVDGQAVATDVLAAVAAPTWLSPDQIAAVLVAFGRPGGNT